MIKNKITPPDVREKTRSKKDEVLKKVQEEIK